MKIKSIQAISVIKASFNMPCVTSSEQLEEKPELLKKIHSSKKYHKINRGKGIFLDALYL